MHIKKMVMSGLCLSSIMQAEQIELNFDVPFPITWYQKGLGSIIHAWYMVNQISAKNEDQFLFDILLGKLIFSQFCFERVHQDACHVNNEEIIYAMMVVRKLQSLLTDITIVSVMRDRIECIMDMLLKIENCLDLFLYVPSDIKAICSTKNIGIKCSFSRNLEIIKETNSIIYL